MATLSFIPSNFVEDYLKTCWGSTSSDLAYSVDDGSYINGTHVPVTMSVIENLHYLIQISIFQISGFSAFAVIFGLSLLPSFISLHYLLKNWRRSASHIIVTGFTVFISSFNIAVFVLRVFTMAKCFTNSLCPSLSGAFDKGCYESFIFSPIILEFVGSNPLWSFGAVSLLGPSVLSMSFVPVFLSVSDAFLLYRAWVVWVHHRKYITLPALVYLASLIAGVIWLTQVALDAPGGQKKPDLPQPSDQLYEAVFHWVPALGFSCALDALTTGMIAGRLIHHHKKQRKLTESRSTIYLPLVTIFIESAALSLISKILQLSVPAFGTNPIVVPLCTISSNLIVLRKALGADVGQMLANGNQDLSALRFHRPSKPQMNLNDDSIPSGFEAHLIRTIGGHTIDIGPAKAEDSEQTSLSDAPKA